MITAENLVRGAAAYLWLAALHSFVAGLAFYAWTRHLGLPAGVTRRRMLATLLWLPLVTAAVSTRFGTTLRDGAWFDSERLLAIPVVGDLRVVHVIAAVGIVTASLTLWQEVVPTLVRPKMISRPAPPSLTQRVQSISDWQGTVSLIAGSDVMAAVANGRNRHEPQLLLSDRLVEALDDESLEAVIRHEVAHRRRYRWLRQHALFAVRLPQLFNPVALWVFREYCIEVEIACDRESVAGHGTKPLARALLAVYDRTDPKDLASRSVLRQRVDLLLERRENDGGQLSLSSVGLATVMLAFLLPWIV